MQIAMATELAEMERNQDGAMGNYHLKRQAYTRAQMVRERDACDQKGDHEGCRRETRYRHGAYGTTSTQSQRGPTPKDRRRSPGTPILTWGLHQSMTPPK